MKKLIIGTIIFIALLALLAIWGWRKYEKTIDPLDVYGAECPVCEPCVITAKSIRQNAVDYTGKRHETMTRIILPASINKIQIGEDIWTKEQLEAIK